MFNNNNKSENALFEDYEDSVFRLAIHRAAAQEGKLYKAAVESLKDDSAYECSTAQDMKFIKFIDYQLRKQKRTERKPHSHRLFKKFAVACIAVITLCALLMISVSSIRIKVFNFVLDITEKYTSFQLENNNNNTDSQMIVNWTNTYAPTFMPEGYELTNILNTDNLKSITYKNIMDSNKDIIYTQYSASANIELDTESASLVQNVHINGNKGTLVVKNKNITLAWVLDNKMFTLMGQVDSKVLIKIAESVKFIK